MTMFILAGAGAAGSSSHRGGCALGRVTLMVGGSSFYLFISLFVFSSFLFILSFSSVSSIPSFFFLSLFSLVFLFLFFFYFVSFPLFLFVFSFLLVLSLPSPLPSGEGVFIRGGGSDGYPTLVQSWWRGRLAEATFVQLPPWLVSSAPFIIVVVAT